MIYTQITCTPSAVNEVAPPTNLSVSLCWSPVTDMGVASVAWQPGEIYYRPYVNQTYYVSVWNGSKTLPIFETNAVSRHLEVVGKVSGAISAVTVTCMHTHTRTHTHSHRPVLSYTISLSSLASPTTSE